MSFALASVEKVAKLGRRASLDRAIDKHFGQSRLLSRESAHVLHHVTGRLPSPSLHHALDSCWYIERPTSLPPFTLPHSHSHFSLKLSSTIIRRFATFRSLTMPYKINVCIPSSRRRLTV